MNRPSSLILLDQGQHCRVNRLNMYAHTTNIQSERESRRRASTRTAAGLLDEAGEKVGQGLVVSFFVAGG